jgi:hypothetical protein
MNRDRGMSAFGKPANTEWGLANARQMEGKMTCPASVLDPGGEKKQRACLECSALVAAEIGNYNNVDPVCHKLTRKMCS